MTNNVSDFIASLSLPKGVANDVLKTDDDCHSFYIEYFGRNNYAVDDLLDFREDKIKKSEITLDIFLQKCYNLNMVKQAFEETFYQSFTYEEIDIVTRAVLKRETTLEKIYRDFKKNPNKNIMKNIA